MIAAASIAPSRSQHHCRPIEPAPKRRASGQETFTIFGRFFASGLDVIDDSRFQFALDLVEIAALDGNVEIDAKSLPQAGATVGKALNHDWAIS